MKKKSLAQVKQAIMTQAEPVWGEVTEVPDTAIDHPTREGHSLVHVGDRPNDSAYPKIAAGKCPPDTYYVIDDDSGRIVHMLSVDAQGVPVAWDTTYTGQYFLGTSRPLVAPRYVEYCWDASRAFADGDAWGVHHPAYKGSLGSCRSPRPDFTGTRAHTTRPEPTPRGGPARKKKSLKRAGTADTGILTDRGLDHDALNQAASTMAGKFTEQFGGSKPKKSLRRFGK